LYKASTYFLPIIKEIQDNCFESVGLEIDNKETKKRVKTVLEELLTSLNIIQKTLESFNERNFDIEHICQIRTECHLQDNTSKKKKKSKGATPSAETAEPGTINEELKERLQQWRTEQYTANNVPAYIIMHQKTLLQIAATVPHTKAELLSVKGFGPATYEKYGEQILAICAEFSKK
jgi:superfamily II DNA helicase RecQ